PAALRGQGQAGGALRRLRVPLARRLLQQPRRAHQRRLLSDRVARHRGPHLALLELARRHRAGGHQHDRHASRQPRPGWVGMLGARYSIGYGKLLVGGLGGVIHFEPQAFVHGGLHDNDGDVGPSADFGLGFLVFLMPRLFVRADVPVTLDWEYRYSRTVTVFGTAPTLSVGGFVGGP